MATDKETFVKLIQQNKKIIFKISNSYCSNTSDRDDLVQEIVFNLWKSFAGFKPDHKFSTWLYRVALNVAISFYRKEARAIKFDAYSEDLIAFTEDVDGKVEVESKLILLQQFIHELNEIDKSIMLLYLDDKSYKEIADIIGISVSNVATKINRIKDKLKAKFLNN